MFECKIVTTCYKYQHTLTYNELYKRFALVTVAVYYLVEKQCDMLPSIFLEWQSEGNEMMHNHCHLAV